MLSLQLDILTLKVDILSSRLHTLGSQLNILTLSSILSLQLYRPLRPIQLTTQYI